MNIKKVDDKPMVIHTKKKMEFHTKEPDKRSYIQKDIKDFAKNVVNNDENATTKGKSFFRNRINEANSSIKIKSQRLVVFLDKVSDIDFRFPKSANKITPFGTHRITPCISKIKPTRLKP